MLSEDHYFGYKTQFLDLVILLVCLNFQTQSELSMFWTGTYSPGFPKSWVCQELFIENSIQNEVLMFTNFVFNAWIIIESLLHVK